MIFIVFIRTAPDKVDHFILNLLLLESSWELRKEQMKDFYEIFQNVDESIPLICVCGNHDMGDQPTVETVSRYTKLFFVLFIRRL